MRAIAVMRGETIPTLIDVPKPKPAPDEALIRTLRVGIDGTDHEVITGSHGGYPEGVEYQILGHEAVGVVEDPNGSDLESGQLVVPTVRRPPGNKSNEYFERGEPDMAPDGEYVERGIAGAHGYMSEYFTSKPDFLVPIPDALSETGFLIEPISNTVKAMEFAHASRSSFDWTLESAIVLGNGPLGLLSVALVNEYGADRIYCLGRRDRPDPTIDIIERLNATYVDSRETPVAELPMSYEAMDLVLEATGYAKHAVTTIDALAANGVGMLLGIPSNWTFEVDGGRMHRELVLENKALVGSVNSHIPHFEAAKEILDSYPDWFTDTIITHIHQPDEIDETFETDADRIKTVIEFDSY